MSTWQLPSLYSTGWPKPLIVLWLSSLRHQFTSGDCVSSEPGSRSRWDRPYEHRWTAACLRVPPTGPGYHTGIVAVFRLTLILSMSRLDSTMRMQEGANSAAACDVKHEMLLVVSVLRYHNQNKASLALLFMLSFVDISHWNFYLFSKIMEIVWCFPKQQ